MPAPIVKAFGDFIANNLNVVVWDGEIPRYDTAGNPISPEATQVGVPNWPVIKVYMKEPGFERELTFEDPYSERGEVLIEMYATNRNQLETPPSGANSNQTDTPSGLLDRIERLLAQASNWGQNGPLSQLLGGPPTNPFYVIDCALGTWWCGQEEGIRTARSERLYRADMHYVVAVHGAVATK